MDVRGGAAAAAGRQAGRQAAQLSLVSTSHTRQASSRVENRPSTRGGGWGDADGSPPSPSAPCGNVTCGRRSGAGRGRERWGRRQEQFSEPPTLAGLRQAD